MTASKVFKILFLTFNFLFFLGGLTLLAVTAHARNNIADYQISQDLVPAVNLLLCVSAVTVLFGFLGCCGAIREGQCLLTLFFNGLLMMFITLLAVGALGAVLRTEAAQDIVKENLKELIPLSQLPGELQELFRMLEMSGHCCGLFVGHLDWGNKLSSVPNSCSCTDTSKKCMELDGREVYSTPCLTYIMTWLDRVSDSVMWTALSFGALMILGMAFSLALMCQIWIRKASVV